MNKFNLVLNYMAAIIIFIAVAGALYLGFEHLRKEDPPKRIILEYNYSKDSTKNYQAENIIKIDTLINNIKELTNNIHNKELDIITKEEEKNIFDKLYSIIVAVILVIAGFFGFKNITEIKERAIEEAQNKTEKIAKETAIKSSKRQFKAIFTKEYEADILKITSDSFFNILNNENANIYSQISDLRIRIERLENNSTDNNNLRDDQDGVIDINDEPINPFDNA